MYICIYIYIYMYVQLPATDARPSHTVCPPAAWTVPRRAWPLSRRARWTVKMWVWRCPGETHGRCKGSKGWSCSRRKPHRYSTSPLFEPSLEA